MKRGREGGRTGKGREECRRARPLRARSVCFFRQFGVWGSGKERTIVGLRGEETLGMHPTSTLVECGAE